MHLSGNDKSCTNEISFKDPSRELEKIDFEYEKSINNPRQNLLVTGSIYLLGRLLSVLKKDGSNSSLSELQDHL